MKVSGGGASQEAGTGSTGAVSRLCPACSRAPEEVGEAAESGGVRPRGPGMADQGPAGCLGQVGSSERKGDPLENFEQGMT